jgi:hypothetical protein
MHRAIAVFVVGLLTVSSRPVDADCDRPRDVSIALNRASVVFRGVAREVKVIGIPGFQDVAPRGVKSQLGWRGWIVTLDVSTVWKGSVRRRLTLHVTGLSEDDAYTSFEVGEEYVVFANVNPPEKSARFGLRGLTYGAHGCGGTGLVLRSASYLRELGPGRPAS